MAKDLQKQATRRRRTKSRRKALLRRMRVHLVTGIVVAIPIVATITVLAWFVNRVDAAVLRLLPGFAEPITYLGFNIPGFGLVIAALLLIGLGVLARNLFGRSMIRAFESLLLRLPVVSSIYNFTKQIVGVFSRNSDTAFKEVCLIEYPRPGLWAVGFITADLAGAPASHLSGDYACVFVPTTPNPTSGFLLFCERSQLRILDMSAEEGAKLIISGGMVTSNEELEDITDELLVEDETPKVPAE